MSKFIQNYKKRILLFFAVLGPGLITAVADNDAGGVATYSVAASLYGMASQAFLPLTVLLLAVTQEVGARMAIATGKGLGDLIREHFGVRVSVVIFLALFLVNQGVVLQNISGLKASLQILGLPWQPFLLVVCLALMLVVVFLNYKSLQKFFLFSLLFYLTYVISAVLSDPDWSLAVSSSIFFKNNSFLSNPNYWFTLIAVLGTTVTAWGQFFLSSYVSDKGLRKEQLKEEQAEVYFGSFVTHLFSWMIALAVTSAVFSAGLHITDGFMAAKAIEPLAGKMASGLFASGLFVASFLGLCIVPLSTAYVFTELFGYERTLNANFLKGKTFYSFFIFQILLALLVVMIPNMDLFKITLYADFMNGAMLPFIFFFLIRFSEDPIIMGYDMISRGWKKIFLRFSAAAIFFAVALTVFSKFTERF